MIPNIFWYWSGFCYFRFFKFIISIGKGSGVRTGLGLEMGGVLIAGVGLDVGLDIGMGIGINSGGAVNAFSSCCLVIFS